MRGHQNRPSPTPMHPKRSPPTAKEAAMSQTIARLLVLDSVSTKSVVSDLVLMMRLRKFKSLTRSQHWNSEKSRLSLQSGTQKISVSDLVSKLRLREFQSRLGLESPIMVLLITTTEHCTAAFVLLSEGYHRPMVGQIWASEFKFYGHCIFIKFPSRLRDFLVRESPCYR